MRLLLKLKTKKGSKLPLNYQGYINAWIYNTMRKASPELATWLHERGFDATGQNYKLFTYDSLNVYPFRIDYDNGTIQSLNGEVQLKLSFVFDSALNSMIQGLFHETRFTLGNSYVRADFQIDMVEVLPKPTFSQVMRYRATSPVCITRKIAGKKYAHYCSPDEDGYGTLLINNLVKKYNAAIPIIKNLPSFDTSTPIHFKLLSSHKRRLIHFKEHTANPIKVRGHLFDFELTAPPSLQEFSYYAGFGEKNSQGFGFSEIL